MTKTKTRSIFALFVVVLALAFSFMKDSTKDYSLFSLMTMGSENTLVVVNEQPRVLSPDEIKKLASQKEALSDFDFACLQKTLDEGDLDEETRRLIRILLCFSKEILLLEDLKMLDSILLDHKSLSDVMLHVFQNLLLKHKLSYKTLYNVHTLRLGALIEYDYLLLTIVALVSIEISQREQERSYKDYSLAQKSYDSLEVDKKEILQQIKDIKDLKKKISNAKIQGDDSLSKEELIHFSEKLAALLLSDKKNIVAQKDSISLNELEKKLHVLDEKLDTLILSRDRFTVLLREQRKIVKRLKESYTESADCLKNNSSWLYFIESKRVISLDEFATLLIDLANKERDERIALFLATLSRLNISGYDLADIASRFRMMRKHFDHIFSEDIREQLPDSPKARLSAIYKFISSKEKISKWLEEQEKNIKKILDKYKEEKYKNLDSLTQQELNEVKRDLEFIESMLTEMKKPQYKKKMNNLLKDFGRLKEGSSFLPTSIQRGKAPSDKTSRTNIDYNGGYGY